MHTTTTCDTTQHEPTQPLLVWHAAPTLQTTQHWVPSIIITMNHSRKHESSTFSTTHTHPASRTKPSYTHAYPASHTKPSYTHAHPASRTKPSYTHAHPASRTKPSYTHAHLASRTKPGYTHAHSHTEPASRTKPSCSTHKHTKVHTTIPTLRVHTTPTIFYPT